jgi:hypothetical protein
VPAPRFARLPLQIAAGLLLVAGGMIAGRASAGARLLPVAPGGSTSEASVNDGSGQPFANVSTAGTDSTIFTTVEQARQAQMQSEAIYQLAAAFLAQNDTSGAGDGSPVAYRSRLAALDQVLSTTREAMRQAPHDPVINGYYLTTLGQREATLRQLNTVLPVSLRANSF